MTITATAPITGLQRSKMNSSCLRAASGRSSNGTNFLIYATAAALVFKQGVLSDLRPARRDIGGRFGSYAVGFLARPLGGALFGHFGDRLGRKSMLALRCSRWASAHS